MEKIEKNRTNPRVLPYGERFTGGEIYPNPTDGTINIVDLKGNGDHIKQVEIFDITGKKLKQIKCQNSMMNFVQIDISDFASGTYIIQVSRTSSAPASYKIQKK